MELQHEFTVPVPVDKAWATLLDLEQVAPCMPGAMLESFDGHSFTGKVKVKVGPITVTYRGEGEFAERDDAGHRAVISARGKEARGTGTANANITTVLLDEGEQTRVQVSTDLAITGRPAQFGRGVMNDVGAKLIGQFATCLAQELSGAPAAPAPEEAAAPAPEEAAAPEVAAGEAAVGAVRGFEGPEAAPPPGPPGAREEAAFGAKAGEIPGVAAPRTARPVREAEPIDLLEAAGGPVLKRLLPLGGVILLIALIWWMVRRRGNR